MAINVNAIDYFSTPLVAFASGTYHRHLVTGLLQRGSFLPDAPVERNV
jgi:hypothetical protein